jgi:hypothetical protein
VNEPWTSAGRGLSEHVRVDLDATPGEVARTCADVLCASGGPELAVTLLQRYPGCLLVSVRDDRSRCTVLTRGGVRITAAPVRSSDEQALLASMLHQWLIAVSRSLVARSGQGCAAAPSAGPRPPD